MAANLPNAVHVTPVRSSDRQAKAGFQKVLNPDPTVTVYRALLGGAIKRARLRLEWSLKEFSAHMGDRDERLLARWESGEDRAPWELLFENDDLRPKLIVALAEIDRANIEIETIVRIRQQGVRP